MARKKKQDWNLTKKAKMSSKATIGRIPSPQVIPDKRNRDPKHKGKVDDT